MLSKKEPEILESRRIQGVELYKKGWSEYDIAEALGVKQASVSRWVTAEHEGGIEGLKSSKHPGPKPKLEDAEKEMLVKLLNRNPTDFGFEGELWTSPRVALLIEHYFDVSYHPGHVRKLLRELGFSPQKPVKRANQRDEKEIAKWCKETWPKVKKTPSCGRQL